MGWRIWSAAQVGLGAWEGNPACEQTDQQAELQEVVREGSLEEAVCATEGQEVRPGPQ